VRSRSAIAGVALSLVAGLVLSACGGSTSDSSSTSAGGDLPTVTGAFGETPEITVPKVDPPAELKTVVLEAGDGAEVTAGDLLVVDYAGVSWDDGKQFDSSFDRGQPAAFTIGRGAVIPGWDSGLVGQTVGSRVMLVVPPGDAYGDNPPTGSNIAPGATLVFVVDIIAQHTADESASGQPTPIQDDGVPALTVQPGEPKLTIPPGKAPPKLIAESVVTGDGPVVEAGQLVVVQYVGKVWRTGKTFDSSWGRGQPAGFPIGVGGVIPGWDSGLVGKTVGSRVLLVIPPNEAYGDNPPPNSGIKAGDTLVFGVDILGAY
jgi:peptidylprolyl isomerase